MKKNKFIKILTVVLFICTFVSFPVNVFATTTPSASEVFAEENNLHILQEGEYAVTINQSDTDTPLDTTIVITLKSGDSIPIKVHSGPISVSVLEYEAGVTKYVPLGNSSVNIYNISDFTGFDATGIVDTAIERKLKKDEEVSVIVKMKLPEAKFFQKGDNQTRINKKKNDFKNAKNSIVKDLDKKISGKGVMSDPDVKDLQIVNSVSFKVNKKTLEKLKKNSGLSQIILDREVKADLDTSLNDINTESTWSAVDASNNTITGAGMRIAIIDTGVDYAHSDLGGCFGTAIGTNCKVIDGWDFINNDADPMDDMGHGTHVAATAAGNGLLKGVAPDAKILAYKVLDSRGSGSWSTVISAIQRTTDPNNDGNTNDHVDVANLSLGGDCGTYNSSCGPDDLISSTVDSASAVGVVFVISAGNSGPNLSTIGSPGTARSAITVAAAYKTSDNPSYPITNFSSRGPVIVNGEDVLKPDVTAPGSMICAARWGLSFANYPTCFDSNHVRISGTSMAAPHVAGAAALIRQAYPNYTPAQVKALLKDTARSLGASVPYNEQGEGIIDLQVAIPLSSIVQSIPSRWQITTDPTQQLSTHTTSFSSSSTDSNITSVSVVAGTLPNGITLTTTKQTLSFGSSGTDTDTFSATVVVDNDVAKSGSYNIVLIFKSGIETKGSIIIPVTVTPTITTNASSNLDYGVDNPSLSSWTSSIIPITFTNKRTDISQTLTFSTSTFASGIDYQITPSPLTIPADSTVSIDTKFSVADNSLVSNGAYKGVFNINNSTNNFNSNIKFKKYYSFIFNPGSNDFNGEVMMSIFKTNSPYESINLSYNNYNNTPITIYTLYEGYYDAYIKMYASASTGGIIDTYNLFLDNLSAGSFTVSKSDANRHIIINPTYFDGTTDPSFLKFQNFFSKNTTGYGEVRAWDNYRGTFHINGSVNSKYDLNYVKTSAPTDQDYYILGGKVTGLASGDVVFNNTVQGLEKFTIRPQLNIPNNTSFFPGVIDFRFFDFSLTFVQGAQNLITPFTRQVYVPLSFDIPKAGFSYNQYVLSDKCSLSAQCAYRFKTPEIFPVTNSQIFPDSSFPTPTYPSNNEISAGLGPVGWFMKFDNTSSKVIALNVPFSGLHPILRQGYETQDYLTTPYTLKQGGVTVKSGNIAGHYAFENLKNGNFFSEDLVQGTYVFNATFPYHILGQTMSGSVEESFDTSSIFDKNPPYLKRISYYVNNIKNQVYNRNYTNKIELDFDPSGGIISTVDFSYSTDGNTFTPVIVNAPVNGVYSATLPILTNTSGTLSLRFRATDDSNNYFQNTIQLPISNEIISSDTTAPVVSITAPIDSAVVSGSTAISVTASDDVSVSRVSFYVDDTFIGFDATSPYSVSWNTVSLPNGTHSLTAKAYDTSNNEGTSSVISVTSNNANTVPSIANLSNYSSTEIQVVLNSNITSTGGNNVTMRGVQYGLNTNYGNTTQEAGSFTEGEFPTTISSLSCGTTYHYKSYATNSLGTGYGVDDTFNTSACPTTIPSLVTMPTSFITRTSVTLNANIISSGGRNPTIRGFEYGLTTSYGATTQETGSFFEGQFSAGINSLTCGTTYHYRPYATNSSGTGYGSDAVVTTSPCNLMSKVTSSVYLVRDTDSTAEIIAGVVAGTSKATFLANLTKGDINQTWNDAGISSTVQTGNQLIVTAQNGITITTYTIFLGLPTITTQSASLINKTTARLNGTAVVGLIWGANRRCGFQYGTTINYGSEITLNTSFNSWGDPVQCTFDMSSLEPNTTYYFRGFIYTDYLRMMYGNQQSFTTLPNTTISTSAISGIIAPVPNAVPVYTVPDTTQYTATMTWSPNVVSTFLAGTQYTATINITPKTGYKLAGVTPNFFTVAGATATNSADSGIVTAVFPLTEKAVMSGTVSITGTTKFGQTLSANIGGLTYTPTITTDVPTYQWKRNGANITGATSSTYTLAQVDIGNIITVTVTADGTHATGNVTSSATSTVVKADGPSAPSAPTLASKTTTIVTLTPNALNQFSIDNGATWQDSNVFTSLTASTQYSFTTKVKETATTYESASSVALLVTTDAIPTVPSQVTDLVASVVSVSQINLSWTTPASGGSTITNYKIERETPVGGGFHALVTTNNADTNYSDTGLTSATVYNYKVSAINGVGTGPASVAVNATTSTNVGPTADPVTITGTATVGSLLTGHYNYADAESNTEGTSTFVWLRNDTAITGAIASTYTLEQADAGQIIKLRVTPVALQGTLIGTPAVSAGLSIAGTVPGAPTGLTATRISNSQINLYWETPSIDGGNTITGYKIERDAGSGFVSLVSNTGITNTYNNIGLTPVTTYIYRLSAINSIGTGNASAIATATTYDVPGKVTVLSATKLSNSVVRLSWTAPVNAGGLSIAGYRIERDGVEIVSNTNTNPYDDINLTGGTTYIYSISAINSIGTGTASDEVNATTDASTAPDQVTGLSATTISKNQINLYWSVPNYNGSAITSYLIERATPINGTFSTLNSTTSTTYSDMNLTPSTEYSYRVSAINGVDTGLASSVASATTSAATNPGSGSSGSGSSNPVITKPVLYPISPSNLNWTTVTLNGNITSTGGANINTRGFNYGTTTNYGMNTTEAGTFNTGIFSKNITGLICGTTYHFRSYATNSAGITYGNDQTFNTVLCGVTSPLVPEVNTNDPLVGDLPFNSSSWLSVNRTLKLGMTGNDVKILQIYLNSHGYIISLSGFGSKGNESTYFGQKTKNAVIKFQRTNKLFPDGSVGKQTRELMIKVSGTTIAPTTDPVSAPIIVNSAVIRSLKLGMTGEDVKALQVYLNTHGYTIAETGDRSPGHETNYFGTDTLNTVKKFQKENGLFVDGIVGKQTKVLMNKLSNVVKKEIKSDIKVIEIAKPKEVTKKEITSKIDNTKKALTRTLKLGMTGEDVKALQLYLNTHGYGVPTSGVDSLGNESIYFSVNTMLSVILFQKEKGLSPNGIVDQSVWEKMN